MKMIDFNMAKSKYEIQIMIYIHSADNWILDILHLFQNGKLNYTKYENDVYIAKNDTNVAYV